MAMEDPNFATDGSFHNELMEYHDILAKQMATLAAGLRCEYTPIFDYSFAVSCADIYTGLNYSRQIEFDDVYPLNADNCKQINPDTGGVVIDPNTGQPAYDQACLNQRSIDYAKFVQANITPVLNLARRTSWRKYPCSRCRG
jgi:hypothetical protein